MRCLPPDTYKEELTETSLMTVFQCIPFEKILNPSLHPHVKCLDARLVMLTPPILVRTPSSPPHLN
jgi:hypothetical protein